MEEDILMDDFIRDFQDMADKGKIEGIFMAVPTGEVLDTDPTYIEVVIYGSSYYAKPCLPFGSFTLPNKAWLQKHKDEVMVWVAFENGNSAHPVYLGVAPVSNKVPSKPYDGHYWKSTNFEYSVSDKSKSFTYTVDNQNIMSYNSTGLSFLQGNDVAVKGNELESWLNQLLSAIQTIVTTDGAGLNPGSIAQLQNLGAQIPKIKSTKIKLE